MKPLLFRLSTLLLLCLSAPPLFAQLLSANEPEDWHTLAVNRKQFGDASPIDAGVQSQAGFTRQLLQVQWRGGDPIDLYIVRPEHVVKPPIVIFLYSWPDDTERFRSDAWCRTITQHGFAAAGLVSALTGQRYHNRPWKQTFVSELPEALGKSVHDVQLLLDYLEGRGDLDSTRSGIFGQGSGGTIALLAASVDPRLKAVDVIDPWGDWPEWFKASPVIPESERAHFTDPDFLRLVAPYDPLLVLPGLSTRTLRLQQTKLNPSTPGAASARLKAMLPKTVPYTLYSSESDYRSRAMDDGKILDWLQMRLLKPL